MSTVAQPHIKEVLSLLSFSRLSPSFQQERCVVNREFWFPLLAGALLGTLGWWEPSRALVFDDSAQEVLSQTLDEDERIYHFLLSTQPKHKTAPLVFGTRSLESPPALCEWHA
jgi:hypothetical protein